MEGDKVGAGLVAAVASWVMMAGEFPSSVTAALVSR